MPNVELALHLHNTRGMGLANVVAGLDAGITHYESSLGGLGGCPFAPGATGNICTEDLVHMLESMGHDTGVDLDRLISAARGLAGARRPRRARPGNEGRKKYRSPPAAAGLTLNRAL